MSHKLVFGKAPILLPHCCCRVKQPRESHKATFSQPYASLWQQPKGNQVYWNAGGRLRSQPFSYAIGRVYQGAEPLSNARE